MRCRDSAARALSAMIVSTCLLTSAAAEKPPPPHERETKAAWDAWQKGQLRDAIKHAEICIREFRGIAGRKHAAGELPASSSPSASSMIGGRSSYSMTVP